MKVKALRHGYYGQLREPGEEFEIAGEEDLGDWMSTDGKKPAKANANLPVMSHLIKQDGLTSPTPPSEATKLSQALANPVLPSAPFNPAEPVFKAKHNGGGNFIVVDASGNQVGEVFAKDASDNTKAKAEAQAEADRLNTAAATQPAVKDEGALPDA